MNTFRLAGFNHPAWGYSTSRNSSKAQRRRKWRRRSRSAPTPSNALHQALGQFLTEMGRVEFTMLLLMDLINEAPLEALFDEYFERTFVDKIKIFKKWCDFGGVPMNTRRRCNASPRSWMSWAGTQFPGHGETWEGAFNRKPRQPNISTNSSEPNTFQTSLMSSRCATRPRAAPGFTRNWPSCAMRLP